MIKDFKVLSEFLNVVFEPKSNKYRIAQLSMANHAENGNALVFCYRERITINGSGLTENCFDLIYGGRLITKPQSKKWKNPFIGVSVWDYNSEMPVTRITYPEIKKEHFDLVLSNIAKNFFERGFSLDSLMVAKNIKSIGHPMSDLNKKVSRHYVLYDCSLGFADEHPAIVVCKQISNKGDIESFARENNICVHEF